MQRFPATLALVAAIAAAFLAQLTFDLTGAAEGPLPRSFAMFAIEPLTALEGEVWRLVTGTLLHAGLIHAGMNLWMLLQVGSVFELLFGGKWLLPVYAASGLVASVASSASLDPGRVSVGASGAIFGVAGALLVLMGRVPAHHRWAGAMRLQLLVWAAATIVLGHYSPNIDNAAHLGGFITGAIAGGVLRSVAPLPAGRSARA